MKLNEQIADNASHLWQQISEGWHHLREKTDRALTRFVRKDGENGPATISWGLVPVDVEEHKKSLTIKLEAPGLDKADFVIDVRGGQLYVSGEKHYEHSTEEGRYHVHERVYGAFQRVVPLPAEVNADEAKARYKSGVLTIELPKVTSAQQRKITVK